MSRQNYEKYFDGVKNAFIRSIVDEEARGHKNPESFSPHFHFEDQVNQFCGINTLSTDEKLKLEFNLANYQNNLLMISFHLQFISPGEPLIDLVRIIRELMIITDINLPLFLSTGTHRYEDVAKKISEFMTNRESNAKSVVEKFRETFPTIDFQKIKDKLLLEINKEYKLEEHECKLSLKRSEYLTSLVPKVEALHLQNDLNCFELMDIVYSYCFEHAGSKEVIYNTFGQENATSAEKNYMRELFKAIIEKKTIPPKPIPKTPEQIAAEKEASKIQKLEAEKCNPAQEKQTWFDEFPYDVSRLKIEIEKEIDELNKSFVIELAKNPTDERRTEIKRQAEIYSQIKAAIVCVANPGGHHLANELKEGATLVINNPDDALNIALLALYYVKNGGSRNILIQARKIRFSFTFNPTEEQVKNYYLTDFNNCFHYDIDAVNALLKPPQTQQASNPHRLTPLPHKTVSDDDSSCAPPPTSSTRPNTPN